MALTAWRRRTASSLPASWAWARQRSTAAVAAEIGSVVTSDRLRVAFAPVLRNKLVTT